MTGVDIRTVQELMGHSSVTMTMRYAHLSPGHLREAVNKAGEWQEKEQTRSRTVTKTVTKADHLVADGDKGNTEALEELTGMFGGAERGRTAASQFCRLLPYHLGTAPRESAHYNLGPQQEARG